MREKGRIEKTVAWFLFSHQILLFCLEHNQQRNQIINYQWQVVLLLTLFQRTHSQQDVCIRKGLAIRHRRGREDEEEVLMEIIYFDYWKAKCCFQQLTRCLSRKPHGSRWIFFRTAWVEIMKLWNFTFEVLDGRLKCAFVPWSMVFWVTFK